MLEMAILGPWVFLLFIGALDWGFYASALISVQSAAHSAVSYTSTSTTTATNTDAACQIVLAEIRKLPNVGSGTTTCGSNPVVTAESWTGPDTQPGAKVTVTYQSISLIPIPGLLRKQFTVTRIAVMRLRG